MAPRLRTDPGLWRLAADLGLKAGPDPIADIVGFCRKKVLAFLREHPCSTLDQLLENLATKCDTLFIEIHSDDDLLRVKREYFDRGERSFADLETQLNLRVYAITFRLMSPGPMDRQFVSLIDCRGPKRHRVYFSKWHELAHLLTLTSQMRLKFCRTHVPAELKDPEETMMDVIAGELGFLPELISRHATGRLTFSEINELRDRLCPTSSNQAAVIGFAKAWPRPVILIHAELGLRKAERDHLSQPGLGFHEPPIPVLRAVRSSANDAAKAKQFRIPANMRVPERSVLHRVFSERLERSSAEENLDWWTSSNGQGLRSMRIHVVAQTSADAVDAIISPL